MNEECIKQLRNELMEDYYKETIPKDKYQYGVCIAGLEDILEDNIEGYIRIFNE